MHKSIYECVITTIDGERAYAHKEFVMADTIVDAEKWFLGQLEEDFGAENYEEDPGFPQTPAKKGYWDEDHETYTYISRVNMCRGIVIENDNGGATFMELNPKWRDDNYVPDRESYKASS